MNPSIDLKGLAAVIGKHALGHVEKRTGIAGLGEVVSPLVDGLIDHFKLASMEVDPITYTMARLAYMGVQAQRARTAQALALKAEEDKKE